MPSIIAQSCVLALSFWLGASSAYAQSKSSSELEIEVRSGDQPAQTCLTAAQLRARVAHFSARSGTPRGLRLVLYVQSPDSAELQIIRDGAIVSRRLFQQLPAACADRRDAVALSIALALERAAEAETAASKSRNTGAASTAKPASGAVAAAAETAASKSRNTGAASTANPASGAAAETAAANSTNTASSSTANAREAETETAAAESSSMGSTSTNAREATAETAAAKSSNTASTRIAAESEATNQPGSQPESKPSPPAAATQSRQAAANSRTEPEPENSLPEDNLPTSISHASPRDNKSPLQFHLGGRLALEAVPMPVWVGSLGIELPLSNSVTLDISALASSTGESALAGARAKASFVGLEALGCAAMPLSIFMLQLCGGATVGLCTVSGSGYFRERPEATLLWAAGLARVMLRWPKSEMFAVRLLLQPHLSISRPQLQVERSTAHLSTQWIGGSAGMELWFALP